MSLVESPAVYDELLDVLAENADAERVLRFQLSPEKQARLDQLLEKNRQGSLAPSEAAELDAYERLEHVVRMLKARIRNKREL